MVLTTPKAFHNNTPHPMRGPNRSINFYPLHPLVARRKRSLNWKPAAEAWAAMPLEKIQRARRGYAQLDDEALHCEIRPWRGMERALSKAEAMVLAEEVARRWATTKTAVATWARRD